MQDDERKTELGTVVLDHLARLDKTENDLLQAGNAMFEAYGGTLYGVDLLAAGAINRGLAHTAGFRTMVQQRNLICAGSILRLQIDSALRFYAVFLVDKPHEFALEV